MVEEMILYDVYEITPDCRKHGRLLRSYKIKKNAEKCMNKSIYRYMIAKRHFILYF